MKRDASRYKTSAAVDINDKTSSHALVVEQVENNSIVLDVGCSYGDLGTALKLAKSCTLYGLEYDQASADYARGLGIYEDVYQQDLNFFDAEKYDELAGRFDCIVFADVLEHLMDPGSTLEKFKGLLKPTGYFVVSLPNISHASIKMNLLLDNWDYTEVGILDHTHLRFFTHRSIARLMTDLGLSIETMNYSTSSRKGSQANKPWRKLPFYIPQYIYANPHSFVLQYILKLRDVLPGTSGAELGFKNKAKMEIPYQRMSRKLKKYMSRSLVARTWLAVHWARTRLFGRKAEH